MTQSLSDALVSLERLIEERSATGLVGAAMGPVLSAGELMAWISDARAELKRPPANELEKWDRAFLDAQGIRSFFEWLESEKHMHLARYEEHTEQAVCPALNHTRDNQNCARCNGTGYVEYKHGPELFLVNGRDALIYEFFKVDPVKLDEERMALLESIRAKQSAEALAGDEAEAPSGERDDGDGAEELVSPER